MDHESLIDDYTEGPAKLREAIAGMTDAEIDAAPVSGKLSTRQVICHLADFELIGAERIKRALAEESPTVFDGDPNRFTAALAYDQRDIGEELRLIEAIRRHMTPLLRSLGESDFQRSVVHSSEGEMTVRVLLERITNHIPHHIEFIRRKREALSEKQ